MSFVILLYPVGKIYEQFWPRHILWWHSKVKSQGNNSLKARKPALELFFMTIMSTTQNAKYLLSGKLSRFSALASFEVILEKKCFCLNSENGMYRCSLSVSMLIVQNSNALLMTIIYMSRNEVTLANKSCFIWAWKEAVLPAAVSLLETFLS